MIPSLLTLNHVILTAAAVAVYVELLAAYARHLGLRHRHAKFWSRPRPLHLLRSGRHTAKYASRHTARHTPVAAARPMPALPAARRYA